MAVEAGSYPLSAFECSSLVTRSRVRGYYGGRSLASEYSGIGSSEMGEKEESSSFDHFDKQSEINSKGNFPTFFSVVDVVCYDTI